MSDKQRMGGISAKLPRRAWEPMSLARVGTFGDVLRGNTGNMGDVGTMKK